ncbi:cellulose binding domain-containing protein [Streptomyces sp. NPDC050095]|uniref:GH12 family glycosyl hydrolase domain-containing protein n=1 Tax=unclassified Streptomyces TaxID=2593676 RepID=UPI00343B5F25
MRGGHLRGAVAAIAAGILLAGLALFTGADPAAAAPVTDCTQWGTTEMQGGTYTYQQNEWNSSARQCVGVDTATGAWKVTEANFSLTTAGPPATYPSSYKGCHWGACTTNSGLPIRVSELGSARSTFDTTQVASGVWDAAYDLWFNSTPTTDDQPDGTELMIWINHRGGVQPIGSRTATVTLDGRTWDVWTGPGASGWKVVSYVLQGGATAVTDLDVKRLVDDATARGQINPAHYLIDAEAGFEIWQGGQGLGVNSFSFDASKGAGGGGDTTPPTAPRNLRSTAASSSSATLAWDPATDDVGVTSYDVYRGGTRVGSTGGTTYTDTGLTASTAYSYTVRALDAAGNASPPAGPVSVTTAPGGGTGTGNLKVQFKTSDTSLTDNAIRMTLQLVNTGSSAQSLQDVEIRYWFGDEASSYTTWCDWAQMGCSNLTHSVSTNGTTTGANRYLKVNVTGGSLAAGAATGDIQLRVHRADWSNFNEADDYSHGTASSYADAPKIGVYSGGQLLWGTAP